jgi:hypothetical protein
MKILIFIASLGLAIASSAPVAAAVNKKTAKKSAAKKAPAKKNAKTSSEGRGELVTNASFDDRAVFGQYQSPEEALVKVENEKGLSDLIGVRKHFKDRLSVAAEQE